jgi:hypothetical protein
MLCLPCTLCIPRWPRRTSPPHFAINLVRSVTDKRSVRLRRKCAHGTQTIWPPSSDNYRVNPDSEPCHLETILQSWALATLFAGPNDRKSP